MGAKGEGAPERLAMSDIVKTGSSELSTYDLPMNIEEIRAALTANIGPGQIDVSHLDRAVNPSAGSIKWTVPGMDEDEEVSEVTGVIVYHKLTRAYWPGEYSGGNEPPRCSSKDGSTGIGTPGGDCWQCPLAKGTTNEKGEWEKPVCRVVKQLFVRRPGELLPTLFNVTPVNIKNVDRYLLRLINKAGKPHHHVVTKIRLEKDTSPGGFKYAKYVLSLEERLPEEKCAEQDAYKAMIEPMLRDVEATETDLGVDDTGGEPF